MCLLHDVPFARRDGPAAIDPDADNATKEVPAIAAE